MPGIGTVTDLRRAHDAGAEIIRIATHCTEADVSVQHFTVARELGMETVGFLMMAHRTTPEQLGPASPDHGRCRLPVPLCDRLRRSAAHARGGRALTR